MIKIFYAPCRKKTREYRLILQGLENNPRVELVDSTRECDYIFLFYSALESSSIYSTAAFPPEKTIFIDYHDKAIWVAAVDVKAYFKRSWVKMGIKNFGIIKVPIKRPDNFHPLHFAVMDEFILSEDLERDYLLTCTLREHRRHLNRVRVLEALSKMKINGKTHIGEYNKGSMRGFNKPDMRDYFKLLKRSKIVVTCNPNQWEGDHRTWEAFASGAMVFVDRMFAPMPNPFIDGKHCIFYDISQPGIEYLRHHLIYYLANPYAASEIAREGHEHAMKYHRTSNRIDNILDVIT